MNNRKEKIEKVFKKFNTSKQIHESVLMIENSSGDFSLHHGYQGKDIDTPFLIASITKLLTTTCILILREQDKLSLNDKLSKYLGEDILRRLHVYRGREYSKRLTLSNLLNHTSGLSDAIEEGSKKSKKRATLKDEYTSFEDVIQMTKQKNAHFAPNKKKRAHYANINYEILGKVLEIITGSSLKEVYQRFIFDPLMLQQTYLPTDISDFIPRVYYKEDSYYLPLSIKSIQASGGVVSTAREIMIFLKAFFGGKLFHSSVFQEIKVDHRLQASMLPIHYDAGYMRISLGGLATLFMGKGDIIDHSGSTGSFAFYYPEKDLFFVGNVNQAANPALPVRLVMQLAMSIKS